MMGGIEQLVGERMDVGRQDEQALMQSYAQNKQLIDLLALQKLKTEKEAAARQMQLQMQQQPQTIAQQREAEVMGLTRNEVSQNAGGAYQQQEQQKQQMLDKIANSGIASTPQAGAMPKMASGGIVSFQGGGDVDAARKVREALEKGLRPSQILEAYQNDPAIAQALKELQSEPFMKGAGRTLRGFGSELAAIPGLAKDALLAVEDVVAPAVPHNLMGMPSTLAAQPKPALEEIQPQGQRVQKEQMAPPPPPPPPPGGMAPQAAPADDLDAALRKALMGQLNRDPTAEGTAARDAAHAFLDPQKEQDALQPYLEKMRAMEPSAQQQSRERLIASLANMAGRSTPGMTLAAGARGGLSALAQQRAAANQSLRDQMGVTTKMSDIGLKARGASLASGEKASGDGEAALRQAMSSGASVSNADAQRYMADAQKTISNDAKLIQMFALLGENEVAAHAEHQKLLENDTQFRNLSNLYQSALQKGKKDKIDELRQLMEARSRQIGQQILSTAGDFRAMRGVIGEQLGVPSGGGRAGVTGRFDPNQFTLE